MGARIAPPFMEATDASRLVCVVVVSYQEYSLTHTRGGVCELSGAVGGRASGAPISIDKASLRAVFRGGSFVDGCGSAAQSVPRRGLRLFAAGGLLLAAMAKNSSRHTPRAYALARREAHAPRRGGGMCNDAARDAFRGPETKLLMPCVT